MGNFFTLLIDKGSGTPFNLSSFQQMTTGLMENYPTKVVGHNNRIGARFHIIGVEHFASRLGQFLSGGAIVPSREETGVAGVTQTLTDRRTMLAIGTENICANGLGEANIASKRAVAASHQHFLPVPKVGSASRLQVLSYFFHRGVGPQQHVTHYLHGATVG